MARITVYGIKNCDTVKKARKWLETNGVNYHFHDFREDGMEGVPLQQWLDSFGWEQVLNRRSTSWRALSGEQQASMDNAAAASIARKTPTLIKRPVTVSAGGVQFGFQASAFADLLGRQSSQ
ncbi:ArsC family reductase [Microbulbifer sp. TYP-18]|uniref:ArsC family reductase n=1 Tax=Microbulbifer sp. TYP-18 TaxID=3230024 RepID=UPI0034C68E17